MNRNRRNEKKNQNNNRINENICTTSKISNTTRLKRYSTKNNKAKLKENKTMPE
jgi:hypothetical protein